MDREEIKCIIAELMPYLPIQVGVKRITLVDFYKEYLSFAEFNLAYKTVGIVKLAFKHLLSFFPGNKPLDELGLREIELFIRRIQANAPKGYRVYFRTLKAAFNKAIDWGYTITNVFSKVKLPKMQRNEPVVIDSKQLAICSRQIENEQIRDMVVFGFFTGCRLGEIVSLTWDRVDMAKRLITIGDKSFTTKGRKVRVVPMSEEVYKMLVRKVPKVFKVAEPSGSKAATPLGKEGKSGAYVFGKINGMAYTTDAVSKAFKKACRKAGIDEDVHFHSLRHSFASGLAQKNVPVPVIQKLMGHENIQTSMVYIKTDLQSMQEAVDKLK